MALRSCKLISQPVNLVNSQYDSVLLCLPISKGDSASLHNKYLRDIDPDWEEALVQLAQRLKVKGKSGDVLSWDVKPTQRIQVVYIDDKISVFERQSILRKHSESLLANKPRNLLVDTSNLSQQHATAEDIVSVVESATFQFKKYRNKPDDGDEYALDLSLFTGAEDLSSSINKAVALAQASSEVRTLAMRCGNDLTPRVYRKEIEEYAQCESRVECKVFDYNKLTEMGAGAFTAVAQASPTRDACIVKLCYLGRKSEKNEKIDLSLVGKGITYDTGGTNLKPDSGMYGMEGDMGGSALALSFFKAAVKEDWPLNIHCVLAISDNLTGAEAYRPNDVVSSLSGKTIEVIHTDAEGRMILADALTLASREKPGLIMDFATLTGTCVRAIGDGMSGVFTNREEWHQELIQAGSLSGERVWPFPLYEDFGDKLKSKVADIKQCVLAGSPDHIVAAYFLMQFIENDVPWVHMDLAASEKEGGLGAFSQDVTGFGPRFIEKFLKLRNLL